MAGLVRTDGADELDRIAGRLAKADDKRLSRHLSREIRGVVKPLGRRWLDRAADELPQRGGLGDKVRRQGRIGVQQSLRGASTSVTVSLKVPMDLRSLNRGRIRHPVFGRGGWVDQRIRPGIFTDALAAEAPAARKALVRAGQAALDEMKDIS